MKQRGANGALTVLLVGALSVSCDSVPEPADLVLRNGKVVTMDPATPEAEAIAVKSGSIVAVGTNEEIATYVGPSTELIDLVGKLAIPGFIESHGHTSSASETVGCNFVSIMQRTGTKWLLWSAML